MRFAHEDPELADLVRRYVTPGRRYLKLGPSLLRMDAAELDAFVAALAQDAGRATPTELALMLEGGWRERRTSAWLISVTSRTEFRDRIAALLLESDVCCAGQGYCLALAGFGTTADAEIMAAYLERYLPRRELHYDQAWAMGALLHMDATFGTDHAARFIAAGGPWQRWIDGPPSKPRADADSFHRLVGDLRSVAEAASVLLPSRSASNRSD
jgi:hypothetical protein